MELSDIILMFIVTGAMLGGVLLAHFITNYESEGYG